MKEFKSFTQLLQLVAPLVGCGTQIKDFVIGASNGSSKGTNTTLHYQPVNEDGRDVRNFSPIGFFYDTVSNYYFFADQNRERIIGFSKEHWVNYLVPAL